MCRTRPLPGRAERCPALDVNAQAGHGLVTNVLYEIISRRPSRALGPLAAPRSDTLNRSGPLGDCSSTASTLWHALQSCVIFCALADACASSWQRKQPGKSIWPAGYSDSSPNSPSFREKCFGYRHPTQPGQSAECQARAGCSYIGVFLFVEAFEAPGKAAGGILTARVVGFEKSDALFFASGSDGEMAASCSSPRPRRGQASWKVCAGRFS